MITHIFKLIWNKKGSNALMILEIFLSFLVLFFVFSYALENIKKLKIHRGFETESRWMVMLDVDASNDSLMARKIKENLLLELNELSRVETAAMSGWCIPYGGSTSTTTDDEMGFSLKTRMSEFPEGFADAIGLKINSGRWFEDSDRTSAYEPIVVNQSMIDEYFDGKNMIDSVIIISGEKKIIGVVDNYKYDGDFAEQYNMMFTYIDPASEDSHAIVLKMKSNTPASYEETVIKTVNASLGTTGSVLRSLDKMRKKENLDTWVPLIVLLSICGFLIINVALGLFGILWYNISRRKGEIGLRRAIGAHTSDITMQFILEILLLTGISLLLGVFFAIQFPLLKIGPLSTSSMYQSIAFSLILVLVIVFLCAFFPSWQASKIQPATALHEE